MTTSNLDPGLWQYELSWEEWKTASQLCDILKFQCLSLLPFAACLIICSMRVFKDMIMFFSQGRPNINSIIPVMDYLDQQLTTSAFNMRYSKLIKASITLGKKTLNWCYDMTDQLKIYCIAMGLWDLFILMLSYILNPFTVLHPCHKCYILLLHLI